MKLWLICCLCTTQLLGVQRLEMLMLHTRGVNLCALTLFTDVFAYMLLINYLYYRQCFRHLAMSQW